MPGIGILSSIDYNLDMSDHFEAGLTNEGNLPRPPIDASQVQMGYNATDLSDAIDRLANVDLIVTLGGFVTCRAAILKNTKNFISLVGGDPQTTLTVTPRSGTFLGCCNLQSHSKNGDRITWLRGHVPAVGNNAANIGLFYNDNSVMRREERAAWGGGQQLPVSATTLAAPTAPNFLRDFRGFGASIQAVVISADPWFHLNREALIDAANQYGRYICYPLRSYQNGTIKPTSGNAVFMGSHHAHHPAPHREPLNAYYKMGVMARDALSNPALANPVRLVDQAAPLVAP